VLHASEAAREGPDGTHAAGRACRPGRVPATRGFSEPWCAQERRTMRPRAAFSAMTRSDVFFSPASATFM
jgi:hypothetical protein